MQPAEAAASAEARRRFRQQPARRHRRQRGRRRGREHQRRIDRRRDRWRRGAIGLPLGQEFNLVNDLPGGTLPIETLPDLLSRAYSSRPDAKAAESRLRAAQESVKSAKAENLPTAHVDANYGVIGANPWSSHGPLPFRDRPFSNFQFQIEK